MLPRRTRSPVRRQDGLRGLPAHAEPSSERLDPVIPRALLPGVPPVDRFPAHAEVGRQLRGGDPGGVAEVEQGSAGRLSGCHVGRFCTGSLAESIFGSRPVDNRVTIGQDEDMETSNKPSRMRTVLGTVLAVLAVLAAELLCALAEAC